MNNLNSWHDFILISCYVKKINALLGLPALKMRLKEKKKTIKFGFNKKMDLGRNGSLIALHQT